MRLRSIQTCTPALARGRGPRSAGVSGLRCRAGAGFTLLELMFVVAIAAVLAVLASGQYSAYIDRAKVEAAKVDILIVQTEIQRWRNNKGTYPPSLAAIGRGDLLDPWGRPYYYTDLTGPGNGEARRDKRLNPLNSDFDLFSAGKDGVFKKQVDNKDSLDDVIRARDGSFIDLAEKF